MYDAASVRSHFPALASGAAFFDGPGGTQTPAGVAAAIAAALTAPLANRGTITAAARNAETIVTDARAAVGDLLNAPGDGVVFGRSMTQLAYDAARALAKGWGRGDEIIVTRLDHDAHIRPWTQAAAFAGATVRWAEFDPTTGELSAEHVAALLRPATRLVAVTGASNLIGSRPPIADIAALVHERGAALSVDGVHLTPHAAIDLQALGADLYFCSPYKFLGPHCGVMAGDPAFLATLHPDKLVPSSEAVPERFELGTLPYELLAGTTAAVDFLASLGPDEGDPGSAERSRRQRLTAASSAIADHEERLRERIETGLAELPGVTVHSRAPLRTPTLLISFADHPASEVAVALAERGINAPAGSFYALEASRHLGLGDGGGLRVGLAPYNDDEDVDRLLEGLAAIVAG